MRQAKRGLRFVALVATASLLLAACGSSAATPIVVTVTPTPAPETTATAAPSASETSSVEATSSAEASSSAEATESATPTPTPTPTPTATPTSPAALCSGNASNQAFFVQAAHGIKATMYCATALSSGWHISSGSWQGTKSGGWMDVTYKYGSTSRTFEIKEGAFCLPDAITCLGGAFVVEAPGHFGPMAANVDDWAPGSYIMFVNPGKYNAYYLITHNISVADAITIGANLKAVPES